MKNVTHVRSERVQRRQKVLVIMIHAHYLMFSDFPKPVEGKVNRGVPSFSGAPQIQISAHPAQRAVPDHSLVKGAEENVRGTDSHSIRTITREHEFPNR